MKELALVLIVKISESSIAPPFLNVTAQSVMIATFVKVVFLAMVRPWFPLQFTHVTRLSAKSLSSYVPPELIVSSVEVSVT